MRLDLCSLIPVRQNNRAMVTECRRCFWWWATGKLGRRCMKQCNTRKGRIEGGVYRTSICHCSAPIGSSRNHGSRFGWSLTRPLYGTEEGTLCESMANITGKFTPKRCGRSRRQCGVLRFAARPREDCRRWMCRTRTEAMASCSRGKWRAASAILDSSSDGVSARGDLVVTSPSTTSLSSGTPRRGSNEPVVLQHQPLRVRSRTGPTIRS